MKEEYKALVKKIAKHYGNKKQTIKAIEELSELIKELAKDLNGKGEEHKIVGEIADAQIMLDQLIYLHKIKLAVEGMKQSKVIRQIKRMENENGK